MSHLASTVKPKNAQYSLRQTRLTSAAQSVMNQWLQFEAQNPSDSPMQDPEWIAGYFSEDLDNISTYLLYESDSVCGSASFLLKDWPLKLHLGEIGIGQLPLRRLRLLGGTPNFPNDERSFDLLFNQLAAQEGYDALYFTQIPVDSALWNYLTTSPLIGRSFHRYVSEEPSLHPRLRFCESLEAYMKKFNKTHRHTLKRKVSRFREEAPGELRFVRYTRPDEASLFLDTAVEVSRKTYQWNLHQRGCGRQTGSGDASFLLRSAAGFVPICCSAVIRPTRFWLGISGRNVTIRTKLASTRLWRSALQELCCKCWSWRTCIPLTRPSS